LIYLLRLSEAFPGTSVVTSTALDVSQTVERMDHLDWFPEGFETVSTLSAHGTCARFNSLNYSTAAVLVDNPGRPRFILLVMHERSKEPHFFECSRILAQMSSKLELVVSCPLPPFCFEFDCAPALLVSAPDTFQGSISSGRANHRLGSLMVISCAIAQPARENHVVILT